MTNQIKMSSLIALENISSQPKGLVSFGPDEQEELSVSWLTRAPVLQDIFFARKRFFCGVIFAQNKFSTFFVGARFILQSSVAACD